VPPGKATVRSLEQELAGVPLFAGVGHDELTLLVGCGRNVHFRDGEVIIRSGEQADVFYVVRHGMVAVEAFAPPRGSVSIETIGPGDVLGWSWLFPPYRSRFDARAIGGVRATAFDGACLREKCDADPALGYDLMGRFAQIVIERLQATRIRLLDVYGDGDR
jgi:CRP/FNR family transcriptional regulator, cyclic AMP receptor protein